jgi:hypothetical protein
MNNMKEHTLTLSVIGVLAVVILGALLWSGSSEPQAASVEILSRSGLHWHPEISIYVKGVRQEIPAGIGLGAVEDPIHTHDASGVIHLEMEGLVRRADTTLGEFFAVWNKTFADFGTATPRMLVNGQENSELLDYPMKDKDKIELYFD